MGTGSSTLEVNGDTLTSLDFGVNHDKIKALKEGDQL